MSNRLSNLGYAVASSRTERIDDSYDGEDDYYFDHVSEDFAHSIPVPDRTEAIIRDTPQQAIQTPPPGQGRWGLAPGNPNRNGVTIADLVAMGNRGVKAAQAFHIWAFNVLQLFESRTTGTLRWRRFVDSELRDFYLEFEDIEEWHHVNLNGFDITAAVHNTFGIIIDTNSLDVETWAPKSRELGRRLGEGALSYAEINVIGR
jgi:hypothetical protein